jgi:hypothetical protein
MLRVSQLRTDLRKRRDSAGNARVIRPGPKTPRNRGLVVSTTAFGRSKSFV